MLDGYKDLMLGDFQYLTPLNESLIEKKKKKPESNDKSHGPIKPWAKKGQKKKKQLETIKKHSPKKIKMKAPKMKWAKFKNFSRAWEETKKILDEV